MRWAILAPAGRTRRRAAVALAALLWTMPAAAQSARPLAIDWRDGLVAQSESGDYRFQAGTILQTDGRFAIADPSSGPTDTFTIRKARAVFSGRLARAFEFKFMPDFANGSTMLFDAYMDVRFSNAFRVRAGKDKTPVGYELLQGDPYLFFPERMLVSSLVPNRDIGFQAQGDLRGGALSYSAGLFNGVPDGTSSSNDLDTNRSKDVAGRVVVQPFKTAPAPARTLAGLGFALGGSMGRDTAPLPSFKTSGLRTWFSYDRSATATGRHTRMTPSVFYYRRGFGAFAEYARSAQRVQRATRERVIANQAWGMTGSYVLTGEAASDRGVRPSRPFDPAEGHWGALQLVARYSMLTVDPQLFDAGFAAAGAHREARAFTVGFNWYPTSFVKYYAIYERTTFDPQVAAAGAPENLMLFRVQLAF